MFSLIISIIAIALVAALALASIYYGGSAFQEGAADATASTVVNQGQQIQGAFTMADVAGYDLTDTNTGDFTGTETLTERLVVGSYLKEQPAINGVKWVGDQEDSTSTVVTVTITSQDVCESIEDRFDSTDTIPETIGTQSFGCHGSSADSDADGHAEGPFTAYYTL